MLEADVLGDINYFKDCSVFPVEELETLRFNKSCLTSMLGNVTLQRNLLTDLSDDEETLALMNLTLLKDEPHLYR